MPDYPGVGVSATLRILVADDHPLFRDGLGALLASVEDADVVGEASTGTEAVVRTLELQPDVVLMDLHMPEINGIEATRRVVEASPHVGVLVLTMVEDDDAVFAAMRAGARGYLVKGRAKTRSSPRSAPSGPGGRLRPRYRPAPDRVLLRRAGRSDAGVPRADQARTRGPRAHRPGESNAAIARKLDVSQKTVRNHVSNVFTKLRVVDRAQAIVKAREAGLGIEPV